MLSSKLVKIYVAVVSMLISMNIDATVIFDNLQEIAPSGGLNNNTLFSNVTDITTSGSIPLPGSFLASSFSTGPGNQFLTDVQLLVKEANTYTGSFTVSLLSNNNATPDTVESILATGDVSQLGYSYNVLDLAVNNFALSENTRYWIELTSTDAGVQWAWAHVSAGDVGLANEYFWDNGFLGANSSTLYPFQMQITTVPLPAGFGLMGVALAMFGICRRKAV